MRLSCILPVVAATTTLLTSGNAVAAVSVRTTDVPTMTSLEGVASLGTDQGTGGEKRRLRYRGNEEDENGDEEEERVGGANLFQIEKLDEIANKANGLSASDVDGKVLKYFQRLFDYKYNSYNLPGVLDESKYDNLRRLYRTWKYHHVA